MIDLLVHNATIATGPGIDTFEGWIAIEGGSIADVGRGHPPPAEETWDVEGRLVTPGLVDPHTHLVYGGDRLDDFDMRLSGIDYETIACGGGGIRSTVAATRSAADEELVAGAAERLCWLAASGATTVEVKSGYGLDTEHELRMLRIAREAGRVAGVRVVPCLLAAHVPPPDIDRSTYVDRVCKQMIPEAASAGLTASVDVFVERIAFTADEARTIFEAAHKYGMRVKAHIGQFSSIGGDRLAAEYDALSVDHCEHLDRSSLPGLANAGTVAVLVPGATVFLGETTTPPVEDLRSHGIPFAVSTDLNPGSSPVASLPLAATLAVHHFGVAPAEAFAAITINAARALGMGDRFGMIRPGRAADLALWDAQSPVELVYWMGAPLCYATIVAGRRRVTR